MRLIWSRIAARLDALGLKSHAASKKIGKEIRNIERAAKSGKGGVTMRTLDAIAVGLETTTAYLIGETDDPALLLRNGGGGGGDDLQFMRQRREDLLAEVSKLDYAISLLEQRQK